MTRDLRLSRTARSIALAGVAAIATIPAATNAQGSPAATRPEYFRAFGIVEGQVNAVETIHALCVERVPATADAQRAAMAAWRERHLALLRLLADQPAVMTADNASLDPAERIDVQRIVDGRARLREQTRRALAQDPERLGAACAQYLGALEAPDMALEAVHAEEIAIIRRGPLGTRAESPAAACGGPDLGAGCGPSDVDRAQRGAAPASAPR